MPCAAPESDAQRGTRLLVACEPERALVRAHLLDAGLREQQKAGPLGSSTRRL